MRGIRKILREGGHKLNLFFKKNYKILKTLKNIFLGQSYFKLHFAIIFGIELLFHKMF